MGTVENALGVTATTYLPFSGVDCEYVGIPSSLGMVNDEALYSLMRYATRTPHATSTAHLPHNAPAPTKVHSV